MSRWKLGSLWVTSIAAAIAGTLLVSSFAFAEQKKRACASEMIWAYKVAYASGKKGGDAKEFATNILMSSGYSKDVCKNYEFNGDVVIPKK